MFFPKTGGNLSEASRMIEAYHEGGANLIYWFAYAPEADSVRINEVCGFSRRISDRMSRKTQAGKKSYERAGKVTWVNVNLVREDVQAIKDAVATDVTDVALDLLTACTEGWNLSHKPTNDGAVRCMLFGELVLDGVPWNIGISAIAVEFQHAIAAVLFKRRVFLDEPYEYLSGSDGVMDIQ